MPVVPQKASTTSSSPAGATTAGDALSQSYPAVRLRPKARDTRAARVQQQEQHRHSLDLSSLESQGHVVPALARDEPPLLNRRLTMDDYSVLARQLDSADALKRQDSQDSIMVGGATARTPITVGCITATIPQWWVTLQPNGQTFLICCAVDAER